MTKPRSKNEHYPYRSGFCSSGFHVKCRTTPCTCVCHVNECRTIPRDVVDKALGR